MTKHLITSYATLIFVAVALVAAGTLTVQAENVSSTGSEVSGTLSSDSSSDLGVNEEQDGSLEGSVSSESETDGDIDGSVSGESDSSGDITGTVSNDTESDGTLEGTVSSDSDSDGNLTGTVSSDPSQSSGGNRGSSGSNRSSSGGVAGASDDTSSSQPTGAVLGVDAQAAQTQSPGFPNTGVAHEAHTTDQPLWSTIVGFFKNIFSF